MPFASTIRQAGGFMGNVKLMVGTWSGNVNDTAGTVTVPGGTVWTAVFRTNDAGKGEQVATCKTSAGTATNTSNVTVSFTDNVTSGTFFILYS